MSQSSNDQIWCNSLSMQNAALWPLIYASAGGDCDLFFVNTMLTSRSSSISDDRGVPTEVALIYADNCHVHSQRAHEPHIERSPCRNESNL
ncbi:hypothetical protein MRB53_037335 [Persea americana]|nr:hypothetical protein MRB53_037335 [Persea americana]